MIFIYPPVVRPCEPPAGIARLCGAFDHHGKSYRVLDANLQGLLFLLDHATQSSDTWTSRALRHLPKHLHSLRSWEAYKNQERYRRAINDLNRILERETSARGIRLSLTNFEHLTLSPVRSKDLIQAAEHPEDSPFYPYFKKRVRELLEKEPSSMIGFSLNYLSQALSTFSMIGFLKREWPEVKLVLGGGLVTSWMRRPHWRNHFEGLVDHLIAGPGEAPLLSLMGVETDEEIHYRPNYDGFPFQHYFAPAPILPYSASHGCYWNRCSFCPERAEGNSYRSIPPKKVIADLYPLVNQQQPVLIHFLDNALSPSLLETICEHPFGVPWYGFVRITHHLRDPDFCLALKRSGCVMLKLGLESGDQKVLDHLQKGIDLKEASSALKNLKQAGIATYVYLLFGTPFEGLKEARKTLEFVVDHRESIRFLNLAIFNMPIDRAERHRGRTTPFYEGDLSLYTGFEHPKGWNRPSVRQFLDKEFKRHPVIASILRRDPPAFTSNHAPFFAKDHEGSDSPHLF